jgi:hypothetical protein
MRLELICFQLLATPDIATLRLPLEGQQIHQRSVHANPLVLGTGSLNTLTSTPDMDQTVSRRFEPSSRTTLIGEQPNPWNVLPLQDVMSRHRGAKPRSRYDLLF